MDQRIIVGTSARGLVVAGPQQAVLVLGPPRSGKTTGLVIPNIRAAWGPVVSTSTKPDVMAATAWARGDRGRCWLYDPTGTVDPPPGVTPLRWSPITGSATWDGALLMARSIVGTARANASMGEASHWTERAEALLAPLLHAAALTDEPLKQLVAWVNRREGKPALHALPDSTARDLLGGVLKTDERELSGIWSTASGALAGYRSDGALASAEAPNFDPGWFVASGDTVYICASGRQQELVAPLVVGLLADIRSAAYIQKAQHPLLLALDEVANIAPMPDLPALVSEGGGQGVLTLACLQDLSQARRRWGAEAEGFGSLFGATVVLPGIGDVRTVEAMSTLCGSEDVRVRSVSKGPRRSRSVTTRRQRRLEPDQISRGKPGHALLIGGGRMPSWTPVRPWWEVQQWRREPPGRQLR